MTFVNCLQAEIAWQCEKVSTLVSFNIFTPLTVSIFRAHTNTLSHTHTHTFPLFMFRDIYILWQKLTSMPSNEFPWNRRVPYFLTKMYYRYILSCYTTSTNFPDSLSPFFSIFHCFLQVLKTTSYVRTELLSITSCGSANTCVSVWIGP